MASTIPFSLVSAFTSDPFGGNPAAVVFVEPSASLEYLRNLAKNINQPIAAVSNAPIHSDEGHHNVEVRSVRFVVPTGKELDLCGHASLGAAKITFELPEVVAKGVTTIHFKTGSGHTLKAAKREDGYIEVQLPSAVLEDLSAEEKSRLKVYVDNAFGRDVKIKDMKTGSGVYSHYILTEIDESEDLEGSIVDPDALLDNGYSTNIITSSSPNPEEAFVSRMFAPAVIVGGEDPVCGSAHCLLSPYWYIKRGIASGEEVKARQVSARGGKLKMVWDREEAIVRLRGQCTIFAAGELRV